MAINKINIIKGKFKSFSNNEGVTKVEFYKESQNSPQSDYFDIVINCAGSAGLIDNGMSPLLRQLNESGLCKPTPSNHGLVVGNKFNAAPGFFINGPLLAGNVVGEMGIWHVEHTGRIIGFAKQIANNILLADIQTLENRHSGKYISNIMFDTHQVQNLVSTGVLNIMKDSFSVIALVSLMFYQNWKLALFAIMMMPLAAGLAKSLGKRMGKATGKAGESSGRLVSFLSEIFKGNEKIMLN